MSIYVSNLPLYLPTYLSAYPLAYLAIYLPIHPSIHASIYPFSYLSVYASNLTAHRFVYLSISQCLCLSVYLSVRTSVFVIMTRICTASYSRLRLVKDRRNQSTAMHAKPSPFLQSELMMLRINEIVHASIGLYIPCRGVPLQRPGFW